MPRITVLFALLAALGLGSCTEINNPPPQPRALSFKHFLPIYLTVATIEIVDEYKSPGRAPYVEHLIPYSPAEAMRTWTRDRLRSVGSAKSLQVIIKDGSVKVTQLPMEKKGITNLFTFRQEKQYDAKLSVEMRVYGEGEAMSEANIAVTANRSVTIAENASLAEREAIFKNMITSLMESINAELEKNLYQYMSNYISYSHSP